MEQMSYGQYEYDGNPNGILDAPLNSECKDLSSPRTWYKTTGLGIKTGWIPRLNTQAAGDWVYVGGDYAVTANDFGKSLICQNVEDSFTITVPDTDYQATFDLFSMGDGAITFIAASGASLPDFTGKKISTPGAFHRFHSTNTGIWYTTGTLTNV